jgi:sugar phosphate isomerase/epimerase
MSYPPFLASCWTHAGDVAPGRGDETSPFGIVERMDELARAGWSGIGLVHADLVRARDQLGYPRLARELRARSLDVVEVEFLGDWWTVGERRAVSDVMRRELLEAAAELGARTLKVAGQVPATPVDDDALRDAFDHLADAAKLTGALVALEPMPFSNFPTIAAGSDFVSSVGNRNGGIIIDIWHVYRGGMTPDDLPSAVDPAHLFAVEINDATEPAPPPGLLWDDTLDARRLPGKGDWDLPAFIAAIRQLGYSGPWGVEILSNAHRALALRDAAESAIAAARSVFDAADPQAEHVR